MKEVLILAETKCSADSVGNHFLRPQNVGEVEEPAFVGCAASVKCGAVVRISLKVDQLQQITDIRFKAAGCSVLIAAASVLTQQVRGRTTGQAGATWHEAESGAKEIICTLGSGAAGKEDCVLLACQALLAAIKRFSNAVRDEWSGEEALICTCFGVSENTIERVARRDGIQTIEEVISACNAGAGCRSCWPLIQDILDQQDGVGCPL